MSRFVVLYATIGTQGHSEINEDTVNKVFDLYVLQKVAPDSLN